jgi:hypothetical protein
MIRRARTSELPEGWDEARIKRVLDHYEKQTDEDAAKEDQAAFARPSVTVMKITRRLVPAVRKLIALSKSSGKK